jgi:hypothetical protein
MGSGSRFAGLELGRGLILRQADNCVGGARAIVGWVGAVAAEPGRWDRDGR